MYFERTLPESVTGFENDNIEFLNVYIQNYREY